jgi:hypothetical protein
MTVDRRLGDYGQDDLRDALLDAVADEAPVDGARARAQAAALAAVAASAALTAGKAAAAGTVLAKGLSAPVKWLLIGALPVAVSASGYATYQILSHSTPPEAMAPRSASEPARPPAPAPAIATQPSAPAVAEPVLAPPRQQPVPAKPRAQASRPEPHKVPAQAPSLSDELAALDDARRAAARGELAPIEAYLRDHPRGALREQAEVIHVEALARAGRTAEAREAAQRFLQSYPRSIHVERVRAAHAAP